jgi:polysaccharide export outer membrane protein
MTARIIVLLLLLGATRLSAQGVVPGQGQGAPPAAPAAQAPKPPAAASDYTVGAGDLLRITVYGEPLLTGSFRVDNDGTFPYQYLNRVKAEGLTAAAIESEMEKALGDGYLRDPQISVEVAEYRSQNVYVQGQVRQPGKYPLPANASLMDAIFLAGGTTPEAGNWVEIWHVGAGAATAIGPIVANAAGAKADARVRLGDVQSGKAQAVLILDNDTIFVPKAERFYVIGQVRNPGAYAFDDDMTVFTAIAMAGGVTEKGSNTRISVRRLVNGQMREISVKPEDIVRPGDQINVRPRRL